MRNHHMTFGSFGMRLICMFAMIAMHVSSNESAASAVALLAESGSTQRAEAVVLVNSTSANYTDFQRYIQPYLNHFGVPYTVLNIATTPVPTSLSDYAVILIGHRRLDVGPTFYLDSTEQNNIVTAVNGGAGLVNFDNDLSANGSTARYAYVTNIFGFGYVTPPTASSLTFSAVSHYITERHSAGDVITTTTPMTLAGITLPASATALATSGTQPFLAVTTSGAGRAVQWGTTNWMSHAVKGPMYGLDDLVWRSIVWAARKPFVMQGMPPFVTMRIDDVSGPMDWIHIANEVGIKPWVGIFLNDISEAEAADLAALSQAGSATIGIHAFSDTVSFYYNQYNGDYPDAVMAANYVTGTQWFTSHGITPSKYVAFHHYEAGTNAFAGLSSWGVQFVATHQLPGQPEWWPSDQGWLPLGPYRLYETGLSTSTRPVYYADYLPIPGHPEYNQQFFNCVTEVRDEQIYEWIPSNDVAASVLHGTRQLQRGLDGMAVPTLFAHQYNMTSITNDNWRAIMQGIASNIAPYQPQYVTMDYACQYARAIYTSNIAGSVYDSVGHQITTTLTGTTDLPTKFYLFTDNSGQIQQQFVNVPTFSGTTQVIVTLGYTKTDQTIIFNQLPDRTYGDPPFTVVATATSSLPVTFSVNGSCSNYEAYGTTVALSGAGSCTVTARQAGNGTYNPAPDVAQTFNIARATPVLTWTNPSDIVYDTPLGAAQLNATASTAGSFAYTPISGTVLNAGAGQPLRVDFTPTDAANYLTATKTVAITVTKATPVITWTSPSDIVYGTPLGEAQLNATASTAGSFAYTPISGTVLNAGVGQPLRVDFTPTNKANYMTATKTVAITVKRAMPTVVVTGGTFTYDGQSHAASGSAYGIGGVTLTPPLTFTYNGSSLAPLAAGVYSVVGSFAGNSNYLPATNTATLTITKAMPTVEVTDASFTYDGQPHTASGSAYGIGGVTLTPPLTFTYDGAPSAPTAAGVYSVVGSFAGNSNYLSATNTATLTITKATPIIAWNHPADIVYGTPLGAEQLNADASTLGNFVYTPIKGTVLHAGMGHVLHVDFTPIDTTNYVTASKEVTITILKAPQEIAFNALPDKVIGDPPFSVTATASSGLIVTFTVTGDCTISGRTITLVKAGTCTVTAHQAGDANYHAAPDEARTFTIRPVKIYLPLVARNRP